jgi:hypothetical protein
MICGPACVFILRVLRHSTSHTRVCCRMRAQGGSTASGGDQSHSKPVCGAQLRRRESWVRGTRAVLQRPHASGAALPVARVSTCIRGSRLQRIIRAAGSLIVWDSSIVPVSRTLAWVDGGIIWGAAAWPSAKWVRSAAQLRRPCLCPAWCTSRWLHAHLEWCCCPCVSCVSCAHCTRCTLSGTSRPPVKRSVRSRVSLRQAWGCTAGSAFNVGVPVSEVDYTLWQALGIEFPFLSVRAPCCSVSPTGPSAFPGGAPSSSFSDLLRQFSTSASAGTYTYTRC